MSSRAKKVRSTWVEIGFVPKEALRVFAAPMLAAGLKPKQQPRFEGLK